MSDNGRPSNTRITPVPVGGRNDIESDASGGGVSLFPLDPAPSNSLTITRLLENAHSTESSSEKIAHIVRHYTDVDEEQ